MKKINILIIEDSDEDTQLILYQLKKNNIIYEYKKVDTEENFLYEIENFKWDIIISDYNLPSFNGHKALNIIKNKRLDTPFILVSGTIGEEKAVEIMKAGAQDYILKDNLTRLSQAVNREILEVENKRELEKSLRESEDIIRQAQKMEAIAKLSGGIGHDFNNLLNSILLNCEALQMEFPENEQIIKYTDRIIKSQKKAIHLTQQLLFFSKKQIQYQIHEVNINNIIINLEKNNPELLNEKIKLNLKLSSDSLIVLANANHIEHLLVNIVNNAVESMTSGGAILIETNLSFIDNDNILKMIPGHYVEIRISDTGCGMNLETMNSMFQPFFSTKEAGKGLGLTIVNNIVKQYKGYIFVDSNLNKGTSFRIFLQYVNTHVNTNESESLMENSITPITGSLLIIDDYEDLLDLLSSFLISKGFKVITSTNGKEALSKYKDEIGKIDLLISDIIMPEMGGLDLANIVRKSYPNLKILFTSGYAAEKFNKSNIINNYNTFLIEKPFSIHSLLQKIYEILNKN